MDEWRYGILSLEDSTLGWCRYVASIMTLYGHRADMSPGFALGGFFSLMSATFAYEDPLSRAARDVTGTKAQTIYVMKEMGRNMWSSGKGFAKVGALYAGVECCIEGVSTVLIEAE